MCWLLRPQDCIYALNRSGLCVRDGWLRAEPYGFSFTQNVSSLVLTCACDAKTWFPPSPSSKKKKKRKSKLFWSLEVWMVKNSSLDFSRYSNFDIASLSRNSCSGIVSLLVIPKLLHIPLSNYQKNNLFFISQIENTHQVSGDMIWFKFGAVPTAT